MAGSKSWDFSQGSQNRVLPRAEFGHKKYQIENVQLNIQCQHSPKDWQGKGYTGGNPKNVGCGSVKNESMDEASCINKWFEENIEIEGERTIPNNMINSIAVQNDPEQKHPWMSPGSIDLAPCGLFQGAR